MRLVPPDAARTAGVFTRTQAVAGGLSYARVRRLVDSGEFVAVVGNALVHRDTPIGPRQIATAIALQVEDGVVSHQTAGALYGVVDSVEAHVTVDPQRRVRLSAVTPHRLRLSDAEVVRRGGVAMTSRRRTVVDLLASLPVTEARPLCFRAVQQGWLRRDELAADVRARTGWQGTPQLLTLLDTLVDGAHSWLEARLIRLLRESGMVGWAANVPVLDHDGTLIAIADVLFEGSRLVVEADGRRFHGDDVFQADRTRQNRLTARGYTVLRFTYDDIVRRPGYVVAVIRATLARLAA